MMPSTKRNLITASIIAAILLIIGLGFYLFLKKDLSKPPSQSVVKPILANELKKIVLEQSDSLYHLSFSYFDLNTDEGTGIIRDVKLMPDSTIYQKLLLSHRAPSSVLSMQLDSVVITHFSFQKTEEGRKLVIDDIIIQNPEITINNKLLSYSDSIDISNEKSMLSILKNLMKTSSTKSISVHNLNLTMVNHNGSQTRSTSLKHINIVSKNINIAQVKENDSSTVMRTALTIGESRIATPDSLYYLISQNIRYIPQTSTVLLQKTELLPRLNKEAFYKKAGFRKDRYHFIQNNMSWNGIDIDKFIRKQQIYVRSVSVGSSYTEIYTDYDYAKRTPPIRNFGDPHERLQRLAFDITIDSMLLHNGITEYAIKASKSNEVAVFKITKGDNTITNITNNTEAKKHNHFTVSHLVGRVMDAAPISNTLQFDLTDKNGAFTITTVVGAMDGKVLNPFAKPLALLEIQSLDLQKMSTIIHGNAYRGKGNIDLYYRNMKIAFLKKKDDETYKKKGLLSFVSNLFTPDDNPNKKGKFKKGPIDIKRDPRDSFFGFLWKCNMQGMAVHMSGLDKK